MKKGTTWAKSEIERNASPEQQALVPGPGEYNYNRESIEIRQLENKIKNEIKTDKDKNSGNFSAL